MKIVWALYMAYLYDPNIKISLLRNVGFGWKTQFFKMYYKILFYYIHIFSIFTLCLLQNLIKLIVCQYGKIVFWVKKYSFVKMKLKSSKM